MTVKLASLKQHIENGLTTNVSRETALQNKLESKMANQRMSIKDANEARKLLSTMSLVSGVSDVLYRVEQMTREVAQLKSENSRVNESMATLQAYIKRKEENLGESAQWMSWAKSILVQVSEGAKVTDSPQKLRTQVEDILLSTVSRRTSPKVRNPATRKEAPDNTI